MITAGAMAGATGGRVVVEVLVVVVEVEVLVDVKDAKTRNSAPYRASLMC